MTLLELVEFAEFVEFFELFELDELAETLKNVCPLFFVYYITAIFNSFIVVFCVLNADCVVRPASSFRILQLTSLN